VAIHRASAHSGAGRAARIGALLVALPPLLVACGGRDDAPPDDDTAAPRALADSAPTAAAPGAPAAADTSCPMHGLWRRCSVVERLERSGYAVTALPDTVRQPGVAIAGSALRLGAAELQLFLFADTADARRQAAAVRPNDARPHAARGIRRPPAVIHSLNLVALLFNNDDHQLERVQLALTAGLPAG
jgi:hypothetical protein